jgi:hypothetical protein
MTSPSASLVAKKNLEVAIPPVNTIFDFRAAYRSEKLPLKHEQLVLPFGQHPRRTAVEQEWAEKYV